MFTAGNDLADFAAIGNAAAAPQPEDANPFLPALARARTPIVAAVNGRAVGVGVTMLLHCDMVFVAEDALLIAPFVNLALVPEAASSLLMPLRIGHARAFEMFVLGEPVNAEKAVSWGIANRAVPPSELHATARAAAAAIAARAPASVVATKSLMREESVLLERMAQESAHFLKQLKSAEFKEAFTAFSQRRAAGFQQIRLIMNSAIVFAVAMLSAAALSPARTAAAADSAPRHVMSLSMCTDDLLLELLPPERIASVTYYSRDSKHFLPMAAGHEGADQLGHGRGSTR